MGSGTVDVDRSGFDVLFYQDSRFTQVERVEALFELLVNWLDHVARPDLTGAVAMQASQAGCGAQFQRSRSLPAGRRELPFEACFSHLNGTDSSSVQQALSAETTNLSLVHAFAPLLGECQRFVEEAQCLLVPIRRCISLREEGQKVRPVQ